MRNFKGFKYWNVLDANGYSNMWRIQFPMGHKTPPKAYANEAAVRADIENIIEGIIAAL
jgi:hypothetical protein